MYCKMDSTSKCCIPLRYITGWLLLALILKISLTLLVRAGADSAPPLQNIALNQVIWGPGPPKLIDFS